MTTIKLSGGDMGGDTMLVRCNLAQAAAPVQVDYCVDGEEQQWSHTQYQCADARHTTNGLIAIARELAAHAMEHQGDAFECDAQEITA
jgi:hypothetical protein